MHRAIPFCHRRPLRGQNNPTIHTLTAPAHGNTIFDFQPTQDSGVNFALDAAKHNRNTQTHNTKKQTTMHAKN